MRQTGCQTRFDLVSIRHFAHYLKVMLELGPPSSGLEMSYATIMVQVDVNGELGGDSSCAKLADRFKSHLIGVTAWMPRPAVYRRGRDDRSELRLPISEKEPRC